MDILNRIGEFFVSLYNILKFFLFDLEAFILSSFGTFPAFIGTMLVTIFGLIVAFLAIKMIGKK